MRHRVHHILLVASLYDAFTLVEDGHVNRAILDEFARLNLSTNPDVTLVTSGSEAVELARQRWRIDLIITSLHVEGMDAVELALKIREAGVDIPVIALAFNNRELTEFKARRDTSVLDRIFLWQGDVRILLAMVKYAEDRLNVAYDTGVAGVPAIIVVEDNVRFYSSFLPVIYTVLMKHIQGLISEGVSLSQRLLRMRVRPKVLLCETFEEAWEYFEKYERHILGLISDIEFPHGGEMDPEAGVELARRMRERRPDLTVVLQSSFPQNKKLADAIGASFLLKGSPTLLHELRRVIDEQMGFGDFIFRLPTGEEVGRASDLRTLAQQLETVPAESIAYHGQRDHFSNWLKARGEFSLAEHLKPRRVEDYESIEGLRRDLIESLLDYRAERDRVIVADFDREDVLSHSSISRIGGGSLGGKARGLAFINRLLHEYDVSRRLPGVKIRVPLSVVLGTDVFDAFLEQGNLRDFAITSTDDKAIEERFLAAPFPGEATKDLRAFLESFSHPLAVRSSGLLEDSVAQPFAGIYETYMLPNNDEDLDVRLEHLLAAVKSVYASTFAAQAKGFLKMTSYRLEEEKMAVIVQEVVGRRHEDRFYPNIAGVARSHNFYPIPPQKAEDGIVAVALGLGKYVVEGEPCVRFCPKYPQHIVEFSTVDDVLKHAQRTFYALKLEGGGRDREGLAAQIERYDLSVAERDGTLAPVASTYDHQNHVIHDGISRPGVRLVTFAPILKHGLFPLAEFFNFLLGMGTAGTGTAVEIEFAVNLPAREGEIPEFGFLQMRPMAMASESEAVEIGEVPEERVLCRSDCVLGNGRVRDIKDILVVDRASFDRSRSREAAQEIGRLNDKLQEEGVPYLLIGVGRWGSTDPYLGIPVTWNQIAGARVIVEAGFEDIRVTPSQGAHFFQNLTSCNVGYFTINENGVSCGRIDWEWLKSRPAHCRTTFVRHIRLDAPLDIKMNGQEGQGVILKPAGA